MAFLPVAHVNLEQLDAEIERAKQKLGPEVVRVKHVFQEDSSGEPAVYFRIVLTDPATSRDNLLKVGNSIEQILRDEIRPYNWGLRMYVRFRGESEQAKMTDSAWA